MAIEIVMPKLGLAMEEGILDEWIKQDGDEVQPGDILFIIESDKALQEIEAFDSGILRISPDAPPVGATVKIGELLAYLVAPGEDPPFEAARADDAGGARDSATDASASASISPPARTKEARPGENRPAISPRAKRVAQDLDVDWASLTGSGSSGRIIERDIRGAAAPASEAAPARQSLSRIRQLTRDHMAQSARSTAPVTLTSEADVTELHQLRRNLRADGSEIVPSYTDLLAKLVAAALAEHPALNASIDNNEIILHSAIHIGIAVDTERGLLVPVIRNADRLSPLELAAVSADLVKRTRDSRITAEELQAGTFTISNLGMYEIDVFTPIINLPQCAILGLGRVLPRQVVLDAEAQRLAIRHMMSLSLTFDHRLVDGAPAARFLQRVKQYAEKPYLWLVN